jgi:hypothetical protein
MPEPRVVKYEARPTRMFGAYSVYALYEDGSERAVSHGTPRDCIARADRLEAELESPRAPEQSDPK